MSVTLEAEWADGKPGEWSAVVRFTLTNGTEEPLVDPLVEFTVADKQVVERHTGITLTRTPGGNTVSGRLESWMNTVAPGETAKFCVNIRTRNKKDVGPLPRDLKVNGHPADGDEAAPTEVGQQDPPTVAVPVDDARWGLRNAPYVDAVAWPTPRIDLMQARDGVLGYILGFVKPAHDPQLGRYRAAWGGVHRVYDRWTAVEEPAWATSAAYHLDRVRALHRAGCTVVLSTGGGEGPPLEEVMSPDEATGEYLGALSHLGTDYLDFDVEGALTSDIAREAHVAVLRGLREQRPELRISHTVPVNVDGWQDDTIALFRDMAAAGYVPDLVNGMVMGMLDPDGDYLRAALRSAEAMVDQMTADWAWGNTWTRQQAYRRLGLTPMFGLDNNGKVFTLEHMRGLVDYARHHDIGMVSGWEAGRDHNQNNPDAGIDPPCRAGPPAAETDRLDLCTFVQQEPGEFSRIAASYTGGHPGTPLPERPRARTSRTPVHPRWCADCES